MASEKWSGICLTGLTNCSGPVKEATTDLHTESSLSAIYQYNFGA